uniref:mRNA-capping enzyme n=1 Tax=Plectus sambesii TaxID=2011161 RepID=A0A914VM93_9BILA
MSHENVEKMSNEQLYSDPNGPTLEKARRFGIPDRWMRCPRKGKVIANKFVPFKTPLCTLYDELVPEQYRFTPQMVFNSGLGKIGLWIDLTKTNRYYSRQEVEREGCVYKKMPLEGHEASPSEQQTEAFIRVVRQFFADHPTNQLIAIHCTHGFNRTGFLIAAYLTNVFGWAIEASLREFQLAREPGIYKQDYITELFRRYGDEDDAPEAPERPSWCFENSHEAEETPSTSATPTSKPLPVFMDGLVPGVTYVSEASVRQKVQKKAQEMCGYRRNGFPGSQPVSMEKSPERNNLAFIGQRPYKVSWKADGVRYMFLIEDENKVYAFDRDHNAFLISNLRFPHRKEPRHIRDTLLDGEMIIDKVVDQGREQNIPRYLIYDVIKFEGQDVGGCDFDRRMLCIKREVVEPRQIAMERGEIIRSQETMSVRVKEFWDMSQLEKLFSDKFQKSLPHEIDGLIFQPVEDKYVAGRCDRVLKWKPPHLNSVDFKLQIVREQRPGCLPESKGYLYVQHLDTPFAEMKLAGKELAEMKKYDKRIIECAFNNGRWTFMRERTDKSLPNAFKTATAVCNSIKYPITQDVLIDFVKTHPVPNPANKKRPADMPPPGGAPPVKK